MGVFEMAKFEVGTKGIMDAVVAATKAGASSIIGKLTFRGLSLAIPNGLTVAQKAVVYIQDTCFNSFANITIKCHLLPIIHPFTLNYTARINQTLKIGMGVLVCGYTGQCFLE